MRSTCLAVALLVLAVTAAARAAPVEKPVLVLDPGGHTGWIWDAAFLPGDKEIVTVSYDKTIRLWDLTTGESIRTFRPPIGPGGQGILIGLALSPDGKSVATASYSVGKSVFPIYVLSLLSGKITSVLHGHSSNGNTVAFSPDGRRLASAANDGTARLWDLETGKCLHVLRGHRDGNVNAVAFSPDGGTVATASFSDRTARMWDAGTGKPGPVLKLSGSLSFVSFAPDGKSLATAGESICRWGTSGELQKEYRLGVDKEFLFCRHLSERKLFVAGTASGVVDLQTGELSELPGAGLSQGGNVSSDGRSAVTVNDLGEVVTWDLAARRAVRRLQSPSTALWSAGWSQDGSLAFGTTGKRAVGLVSARKERRAFNATYPLERCFRVDTLELLDKPPAGTARFRQALGELSLVKRGTQVALRRSDKDVQTFEFTDPDMTGGGDWGARSATFLDRGRVAFANGNGVLGLFSAETGKPLRRWRGHTGAVWALAPSPNDRYVLSASHDHTARVWTPDREEPLLSLFVARDDWVAWTPEGYYACSPGGEYLIGWHVNNGLDRIGAWHPATRFRNTFYRPDVIRRLLAEGSVAKALAAADAERGQKTALTEVGQQLPPLVVLTRPDALRSEWFDPVLEVRCLARPSGKEPITALRLLVDGRPHTALDGYKRFTPPRSAEVRETWMVKLGPGKHTLAVKAESAVSHSVSEEAEVTLATRGMAADDSSEKKELARPSLYVLAVGISEYKDPWKLRYAAKDARVLAETFQAKSKGQFRKVEVKVLTDAGADRKAILQGLSWARKQATQKDVVILSFAGHGLRDSDGSLYLMSADADPEELLATAVSADQLKRTLQGMPGRALLLLDACHAGAVGGDRRRGAGGLTDDLVRDLATDDYGVVVMCSSMGREFSLESDTVGHGFFTAALIEGLSGKGGKETDGAVYLHHLEAHVIERVKALSGGRQHPVVSKPTTLRSFPLAKP